MAAGSRNSEWLMLIALLAITGGLFAAPPSLAQRFQAGMNDAAAPGRRLVLQAWSELQRRIPLARHTHRDAQQIETLEAELTESKRQLQQLAAALAAAKDELAAAKRVGGSAWSGETGTPLIRNELLSATVLGAENAELCRQRKLLDRGASSDVAESSLVLDDPRPLIDQGSDGGLESGQSVQAGRCIVGRIATAGRWVSTVQSIADPEFRGLARIIRGAGADATFGAEGVLEGAGGGLCRLKHLPATEAVSVGDTVYSAGGDAISAPPLWYGTVVRAELPAAASHWEIVVQPAVPWDQVRTVQVLRTRMNPDRILAN